MREMPSCSYALTASVASASTPSVPRNSNVSFQATRPTSRLSRATFVFCSTPPSLSFTKASERPARSPFALWTVTTSVPL